MRHGSAITSPIRPAPNGTSGPAAARRHAARRTGNARHHRFQSARAGICRAGVARSAVEFPCIFGGYGQRFAEAGYRQWAKRMQEDVTDAVNDLIKRGIADPKRVASYGASYGGYAALMGAILTPDLYRAVVSLAGVTDLRDLIAFVRKEDGDDLADPTNRAANPIGDPKDRQGGA